MNVTLPPSLQSITKNKITFGDVNISFPCDSPKVNTQSNLLNQSSNSKYNLTIAGPFLYFTKSTIANSSVSISFKMLSNVNPSFVIFIPNFIIKNSTRLSCNENSPNYKKNNFSVSLQLNCNLFSNTSSSNFQEININSQTYFIGEIIIAFNSSDLLNNFVSSFTASAFDFQSAIKNCPERELCKIGVVNCIGIINQKIDGRKNNRVYIDENFKISKARSCNLVLVHLVDVYSIQLHGTIISNCSENEGKNETIACLLDLPINQTTTVLTFSQFQNIASNSSLSKSGSDSNSSSINNSSSYSFFDQFDMKYQELFKQKPELSCVFAISDIENGIEVVFCCEKSCDALCWVSVIYSWILKASSSRDSSVKIPNSPLQSPNSSPRRKSDFGDVCKRLNFEFSSSDSDDEEYFLPKATTRFIQLQKVRSNQIIQKRIPLNNVRRLPPKNFVKFSIDSSSDYYEYYSDDDDDESNDKNNNLNNNNEKNDDEKKKLMNVRNCQSDNINCQRENSSDNSKYILEKLNEHYNAKNNANANQKSNNSIQNDENKLNNSQFIMNKLTNYYKKKNEAANVIFQSNQANADSHLVNIKKSSAVIDLKNNTKKIDMKQKENENLKNEKQSTNSSENSTNLLAKQKNINESKAGQNINKSKADSSNNQNSINESPKSLNNRIIDKQTNNLLRENDNVQQSNYSTNNNKNENNIEELKGESTFNFPSGGVELIFHSFFDSESSKNPQKIQESFDSLFPYLDSKPDDDDNEQNNESIDDFQTNNNEPLDTKLMHARKLIGIISSQSSASELKLTTSPIIVQNFCHKDVVNSSIKTLVDSFTNIRKSTTENNEENCYNSFEKCDERSIDEVIDSSLLKLENSHSKIKDFLSFDFDQLLTNTTMKRPIVEEYAYSIQQIVSLASNEHLSIVKRIGTSINDFISKYSKHGNKLNSVTITESAESLRLCFLLSALFLNGLKGFNSFGLENEFLDALKELTVHVSSLKEIYELVSTEKTILTQISKFVILLLNTQSLISVLDSILDQENWISEFYSSTSYLRDEETLRQIIICHSVVQNMNFDINENTNIIANASYEDKIIFIFKPAYCFL